MTFRSTWHIDPFPFQIAHGEKIVLMGSCFSNNIGSKLRYFGFDALVNPFGTLFHPLAIAELFEPELIEKNLRLLERNNQWYCYDMHSAISGNSKEELLERISEQHQKIHAYLKESKLLVITFGSAWGYYLNNQIVANCHKMPGNLFSKTLTELEHMAFVWKKRIAALKNCYPKLEIMFTVSPVRHTKDGMVENQWSKSRLIELVHQMDASYFPSYEIQMDDLRDYRFYEADMIHPNKVAIDYIFEKFAEVAIHEFARNSFSAIHKFRMFEQHKILGSLPKKESEHAYDILERKNALLNQNPHLCL